MNPQTSTKPHPHHDGMRDLTISFLGRVAYFVMAISIIVLAVTGIGTFITGHAPMTHWTLMAHVSAAPLFAMSLAFVALTWSDHCRFGCPRTRQTFITKLLLWFILLVGLIVVLTGVVPMLPLLGTTGQHLFYLTHRYCGITLACGVVLHLVNLFRRQ